jgi:hypothetical protein
MKNGGKRPGAGRPKGARSLAQKKAIDMAAQVLAEVDQVQIWKKLLKSKQEKIVLGAIQYLTDRAHGKPAQRQIVSGDPENPIAGKLILIDAGSQVKKTAGH